MTITRRTCGRSSMYHLTARIGEEEETGLDQKGSHVPEVWLTDGLIGRMWMYPL